MSKAQDWRHMLRDARKALGLNQAALAAAAGFSAEAVRKYEQGARHPSRERLEKMVVALKLPAAEANLIREALGYAAVPSLFVAEFDRGYFFSREELPSHVAAQPWPEFSANDVMEVIAVNPACEAIWGIDFATEQATRSRAEMNLLAVASDHHFADRVVNWDEVVEMLVGVFKGKAMSFEGDEAYGAEVFSVFTAGDPAFLGRLLQVFERAAPMTPKVRWTYPVVWRCDPHGVMRFLGTVSTASEPDGFSFNSWIPIDAESWRVLEDVKASHAASALSARSAK